MRTPVSRIERLAGLFVVLALVVLAAVVFFPALMSGRLLKLYQLEIRAPDGLGLAVGDKVVMQGIQVGEVIELKLDPSNKVIIDCKIYPPFREKITVASQVSIVPPALLGSPRVIVAPRPGLPLAPGTIVDATVESSIVDKVSALSVNFGRVFEQVESRIRELGEVLVALRKLLDTVNAGDGTVAKLLHEKEVYTQLTDVLHRADQVLVGLDGTRARIDDFSQALPALKEDVTQISGRLRDFSGALPKLKDDVTEIGGQVRRSLSQIEKGLDRFPDMASDTAWALQDARKVLESLKRNFLIRGNLPEDPEGGGLVPASRRELPTNR